MNIRILIFVLLATAGIHDTTQEKFALSKGRIRVCGTSSVRDWELISSEPECEMVCSFKGSKLLSVSGIKFSVPVNSLKGHAPLMNKRVYKAMRGYPYSKIYFNGVYYDVTPLSGNETKVEVEGNLSIAGITRATKVTAFLTTGEDGKVQCSGSKKLNMSDFKVFLPESLVENMKISDTVELKFDLLLKSCL